MVRNLIRNQAPGNRLRVRIPCPPLEFPHKTTSRVSFAWSVWVVLASVAVGWNKQTQGATPAFLSCF